MAKNEFLVHRVAKASFTLTGNVTAATTHYSGILIPSGAIITGARIVAPNAITITAASGTVQLAVGGVNIVATSNVSTVAAQTVPRPLTMATTAGNYLTAAGELILVEGASNNSSCIASYDVYVDYIYA